MIVDELIIMIGICYSHPRRYVEASESSFGVLAVCWILHSCCWVLRHHSSVSLREGDKSVHQRWMLYVEPTLELYGGWFLSPSLRFLYTSLAICSTAAAGLLPFGTADRERSLREIKIENIIFRAPSIISNVRIDNQWVCYCVCIIRNNVEVSRLFLQKWIKWRSIK